MGSLQTRHLQDVLEISHRASPAKPWMSCSRKPSPQWRALSARAAVFIAISPRQNERFGFREGKQRRSTGCHGALVRQLLQQTPYTPLPGVPVDLSLQCGCFPVR